MKWLISNFRMKIVSLNVWGGKTGKNLLEFFQKYEKEVDVFCLQEVFHRGQSSRETFKDANMNLFDDISKVLTNFRGYFHPTQTDEEGLAIFVRDNVSLNEYGDVFVFRSRDSMVQGDSRTLGRNLQYVSVTQKLRRYLICNFHGLWNGMGKEDSTDRIEQSKKILRFLNSRDEHVEIILGDFNLHPHTRSLKILQKNMKNLVTQNGITSTRTSFYPRQEIADYVLLSSNAEEKDFKKLPDEVSDHAPLYLEI